MGNSVNDQADTLRKIMQNRAQSGAAQASPFAPHVITVSSGKGGVGKSCLVANLGALLARSGLKVLLVDADFGLANLDILFNVQSKENTPQSATLEQVLDGSATLQQAVIGLEANLWLLPSSSGIMDLRQSEARADFSKRNRLAKIFEEFPWEMDVILVDTGAGIQDNVLSLHSPNFHSVVILTPEPTSITDAYSLIKLLRRDVGVSRVSLIVNQAQDGKDGLQTFQKLKDVAARFIDVELEYLGHWERDEKITQSVIKRKILVDLEGGARSVPSLELLAKRVKSLRLGWIGESQNSSSVVAGSDRRSNSGSPVPIRVADRITGRFKDEPARLAPGNGAKFWRTLLGEVKA